MGSEDPDTGEMDYLVAIEEQNDPDSPIEQTKSVTRMNRARLSTQEEVVPSRVGGMYSARDRAMEAPISTSGPVATAFVKA